jgi:hypothetical protein
MEILLGLDGASQDGIRVAVIGDHNVLVAASGADGETTGIIRVESADLLDADVELRRLFLREWWFGFDVGKLNRRGRGNRWVRFCGTNSLPPLD